MLAVLTIKIGIVLYLNLACLEPIPFIDGMQRDIISFIILHHVLAVQCPCKPYSIHYRCTVLVAYMRENEVFDTM